MSETVLNERAVSISSSLFESINIFPNFAVLNNNEWAKKILKAAHNDFAYSSAKIVYPNLSRSHIILSLLKR